jgi:hypothetical protein
VRAHSDENPWAVEPGDSIDIGLHSGRSLTVTVSATHPGYLDVFEPGLAGAADVRVAYAAIEFVRYRTADYASTATSWLASAPALAHAESGTVDAPREVGFSIPAV